MAVFILKLFILFSFLKIISYDFVRISVGFQGSRD